jgi:hypothetical protein
VNLSLQEIARCLGGEIRGNRVYAPGPDHSKEDRSLVVMLADDDHDGFTVHSFAGDDPIICRDHVREKCGIPEFKPKRKAAREVSFDYRDAAGAVRYRKRRIEFEDGGKTFVIEPKGRGGSAPLLYGGERLADLAEGQPVFIVEGEKKVDRLRELGAIAVCADSGAQSKWLPSHAALLRGLDVLLWPDSDKAGEKYAENAVSCLKDSAASIRIVRPFGPPNGGSKGLDVCDWSGGGAELLALVAKAEAYVHARDDDNPIKTLSYDEMVALPPIDWAIYGVWPRRSKSVIFGQSDSFKSFLAIDLACSAATGLQWHGHAVKQFKVIYIANEGANAVGRKRIPAWMTYHQISQEKRRNIYLIKVETILPDEVSRGNLIKAIRAIVQQGEDFGLVIDVLRGTMTGSENDDEAAHAWTSAAEILIEEGATIMTVTHSPYAEDGRMRGHSHLWGSFDTRLHAEGNKEALSTVLRVNRHKDHDSGGEWGFQLEVQEIEGRPDETSLVPWLDSEAKAKSDVRKKKLSATAKLAQRAIFEAIDELGAMLPDSSQFPRNVKAVTLKQWGDKFGILSGGDMGDKASPERRAFYRAKTELQDRGYIGISTPYVWVTRVTK